MNFSNVSSSHVLQFFTICTSMGPFHGVQSFRIRVFQHGPPHGVTSPASKPAPAWATLSTDPQVLPRSCSCARCPWGHTLLQVWVDPRLQVDICSTVDFHGLQRNLCSGAWSTSSPSFFTDLGVGIVVSLTYSQPSLPIAAPVAQKPFPLLKYVITEVLPLFALARGGSVLELSDIGSICHRGSF